MTFTPQILELIQQELATGRYADEQQVVLVALTALREEREAEAIDSETLAGIKRGLVDSAAGRYKTVAEFDRDFRMRHGLGDEV